jgi:hypothetical protein
MTETWKPSIQIWPFAKAPEEFRALSPFDGGEESVIYVPPELVDEDDSIRLEVPALWFLDFIEKTRHGRWQVMYAGDEWGEYALRQLPNRALVAVTANSERKYCLPSESEKVSGSPTG